MTTGIVYFVQGNRYLTLGSVALATMRQHYDGPAAVICCEDVPEWWIALVEDGGVEVVRYQTSDHHIPFRGIKQTWCRKPYCVPERTPYDLTLCLDLDVVWCGPIAARLWDDIARFGVSTGTGDPNGIGEGLQRKRRHKIAAGFRQVWQLNIPLCDIRKVAGCCVGYARGHPSIVEWRRAIETLERQKPGLYIRQIPDEYALSYLLHSDRAGQLGRRMNWNVKVSKRSFIRSFPAAAAVVHFGHRAYLKSQLWHPFMRECVQRDAFSLASEPRYRQLDPHLYRLPGIDGVSANR